MPKKPIPIAERLPALTVRAPNGCLLWQGKTNEKRYGYIRDGKRMRRAHRVAHELATGQQPEYVCHHCDTPNCIEPTHLFDCTSSENAIDRERKGRGGRTKLTGATIEKAKRLRKWGWSLEKIAGELGVDRTSIASALDGQTFKWLAA